MKVQGRRKRGKPKRRWLNGAKRRDCQLMKCTTVLHGGVYRQTSTPHKSGNKIKKKKKRRTVCTHRHDTLLYNAIHSLYT